MHVFLSQETFHPKKFGVLVFSFVYIYPTHTQNPKFFRSIHNTFRSIQQFSFYNNSIASIENAVFLPAERYYHYVNLKLNKIKRIIPNNFNGLNTLRIELSFNEIEVLDDCAFNSTYVFSVDNSLKYLSFDNNRIKTICSKAFHGLYMLEELLLYNNSLERILAGQFSSLGLIIFLDLGSNRIETIEKNALMGVNITRLVLERNPIKLIDKNFVADLSALTFIKFSKKTLLDLGLSVLVDAFQPRRVAKKNVYTFYKAIFIVGEVGVLYDESFCS
jgi:hypothetical protein